MDRGGDSRYSYICGRSTAGFVVIGTSGEHTFDPLWAPSDNLLFLLSDCTVCASSRGLLLCHIPDGVAHYILFNPYIDDDGSSIRYIPNPNPLHESRIPRVLFVNGWSFHIVCASLGGDDSPVYDFDVYNSSTDKWRSTGSHDLGFLREDTGVSCGTKAYWLRRDAPMAAHYDIETDSVGNIALPDAYVWLFSQPDVLRLQLGEVRNRLRLVVATDNLRAVYTAGDGGSWVCNYHEVFDGSGTALPVLSRFEDYRLQVPFWFEDGTTVILFGSWADSMSCNSIAVLKALPQDVGGVILPLVHTRLNPVLDFPVVDFS